MVTLNFIQLLKKTCILISCFISFLSLADTKNSTAGMLDFNLYPLLGTDGDNIFTLNAAAILPKGFSYFSLLNIASQSDSSSLKDTTSYYTEQNIRWKIADDLPLDLTIQLNFRTGKDNDRHRLGIRWRLNDTDWMKSFFDKANISYAINLHGVQFDHQEGNVWQLEHAFKITFPSLSDRVYLSGFIDHTFNETLPESLPTNPIVAEVQLGVSLLDNLYVIAEYRVNEYRRDNVSSWAMGMEYKILW